MNIADIVGGFLSGGATGLIGVAVQRVYEYKSKQLDIEMQAKQFDHEVAMRKADAEIMAQEWASRTKVAEVEASGKEAVADSQAFSVALTSEPQRYSDPSKVSQAQEWIFVFLDAIRGAIRPTLTIYLCAITTVIYFQAKDLLGNGAPIKPDDAVDMVKLIVETVLYLTTTCVLFWFGTRNKQQPPKRK